MEDFIKGLELALEKGLLDVTEGRDILDQFLFRTYGINFLRGIGFDKKQKLTNP